MNIHKQALHVPLFGALGNLRARAESLSDTDLSDEIERYVAHVRHTLDLSSLDIRQTTALMLVQDVLLDERARRFSSEHAARRLTDEVTRLYGEVQVKLGDGQAGNPPRPAGYATPQQAAAATCSSLFAEGTESERRAARLRWASDVLKREVESFNDLSDDEARRLSTLATGELALPEVGE